MRITDIALEPGEKILGEPASGDVVRWILALGKSMQSGVEQWHVYLKPTRPDLETNLAINTDRRSYLLELHSYADTYMAAIVWHYPEDELARLQAQAAELAGQQKNAAPGRRHRRAQLQLRDPGRQRRARVDAGAGLRRRAAHLRPLSLGHGAARGARALRASRRGDAARQLPRQERHVRHRPAHRCGGAARRAEGPGDRAHRAHRRARRRRPVHAGKGR